MTDSAADPHAHVLDSARFGFNGTGATHVPHPTAIGTRQQLLPVIDVPRQSGFRALSDRWLPDAVGRCKVLSETPQCGFGFPPL